MTAFRDQDPRCPRCRGALLRDTVDGKQWVCTACRGAMIDVAVVAEALLAVAPDLQPAGMIRDVATMSRAAEQRLPCPRCQRDLEPGFLGGVEIERCRDDGVFWLERGELDAVLDRARAQHDERTRGLLDRLRAFVGW